MKRRPVYNVLVDDRKIASFRTLNRAKKYKELVRVLFAGKKLVIKQRVVEDN